MTSHSMGHRESSREKRAAATRNSRKNGYEGRFDFNAACGERPSTLRLGKGKHSQAHKESKLVNRLHRNFERHVEEKRFRDCDTEKDEENDGDDGPEGVAVAVYEDGEDEEYGDITGGYGEQEEEEEEEEEDDGGDKYNDDEEEWIPNGAVGRVSRKSRMGKSSELMIKTRHQESRKGSLQPSKPKRICSASTNLTSKEAENVTTSFDYDFDGTQRCKRPRRSAAVDSESSDGFQRSMRDDSIGATHLQKSKLALSMSSPTSGPENLAQSGSQLLSSQLPVALSQHAQRRECNADHGSGSPTPTLIETHRRLEALALFAAPFTGYWIVGGRHFVCVSCI